MSRLSDHNVLCTVPDLEAARNVIQALNDAGVDSDRVSMLGRQVEKVASDPDTRLRDLDSTADLAASASTSAGAGALIGGIAGALAWVLPGVGPVIGAGIWAAAGGGAIAGSVVGGMAGAIGATELGPDWEVTYGQPLREGKVVVLAHAADESEASAAAQVMQRQGADRIEHIDRSGKKLENA